MYRQMQVFMNMYVHATYNLSIFMYMYIACTFMFKMIGNLVNMYRHVCTMFSDVRTVLPILVQVVRIPDAVQVHHHTSSSFRCALRSQRVSTARS